MIPQGKTKFMVEPIAQTCKYFQLKKTAGHAGGSIDEQLHLLPNYFAVCSSPSYSFNPALVLHIFQINMTDQLID